MDQLDVRAAYCSQSRLLMETICETIYPATARQLVWLTGTNTGRHDCCLSVMRQPASRVLQFGSVISLPDQHR